MQKGKMKRIEDHEENILWNFIFLDLHFFALFISYGQYI